ncbi:hypothetical protein [Flavihumibacter profundi]|jgi:polyisoprenoid-binding protein YceI|uniref:hypothetical protein n=1 Tax=Flavihumibacter profundi TaxID=2716883 RepID=UPI001CC67AB9|nr:hypothetical protein [Flavihumibacter profundi]MBZ5858831.1 hypothetical protein [Flavihumibacter profundi]
MKLLSNKILVLVLILFSTFGYIVSCTHEDVVPPAPASTTPVVTHGTNVHLAGIPGDKDSTTWKLDKVHSSTLWSTAYVGAAGLLTGRFNQFGMHDVTNAKMLKYVTTGQPLADTSWAFYENDPTKTYFNGYVQINTSNTGEPGRDAGCNIPGMNTVPIISGTQNLEIINLAKIKTKKVEFDKTSNDYIVTFDLTWHKWDTTAAGMANPAPITQELVGRLKYITKAQPTGQYYYVFGLQLLFQFNCRDFGIPSTSIGDKIDIECNMNFNNKWK